MLYITLLDQFHPGIYSSQVVDVCDYLNEKHNAKIRLVAFLSIKELRNTNAKVKLKQLSPNAIILPAFPKLRYFQWTVIFLFIVCIITGERVAICRNIFCTKMALQLKKIGLLKKVILDGRSAIAAEIKEYDVFPVNYLRNNVALFEKEAVLKADYRIAVSDALVNYWKEKYAYVENKHVVIPCTLDTKYFNNEPNLNNKEIIKLKQELQVNEDDILLAYSGSTAPWQSFSLMENFLQPLMYKNKQVKVLFLSKKTSDIIRLENQFPGRIIQKWVEHKDVLSYLSCADYGLLLREQSITNQVASPTKFAEYLYAGLSVIISNNLGDFSKFVLKRNCGVIINNDNETPSLNKIGKEIKTFNHQLACQYFIKNSIELSKKYMRLLDSIR